MRRHSVIPWFKAQGRVAVPIGIFLLLSTFLILPEGNAMDLDRFQWKNRLLFLFAPGEDDPFFSALKRELLSRQPEVEDRDLVVFEVLRTGQSRMNTTPIDPQTTASLRRRFSIPRDWFALVLVGKDGGVKMKRTDHVRLEEVFALFDAMPMRVREMKQKGRMD